MTPLDLSRRDDTAAFIIHPDVHKDEIGLQLVRARNHFVDGHHGCDDIVAHALQSTQDILSAIRINSMRTMRIIRYS